MDHRKVRLKREPNGKEYGEKMEEYGFGVNLMEKSTARNGS